MLIRAGYEISVQCEHETSLMAMLSVHPSRTADLRSDASIVASHRSALHTSRDELGNLRTRTLVSAGTVTLSSDFLIHDTGLPDEVDDSARVLPVSELPDHALTFLLGSRYCELEKLGAIAWSLFGTQPRTYELVQSIVDYVHQRLTFGYAYASATRTAYEAHQDRVGVCRDFAHLAIALCRCMNIPARYCTGYLGDIGVPALPDPMDFSAWFEVFLGDRWFTFDARHNRPRIGRILMARGRDAADVAIFTTFGASELTRFRVITAEVDERALTSVA
jgi:transglutaminase-like putative cysteine protease